MPGYLPGLSPQEQNAIALGGVAPLRTDLFAAQYANGGRATAPRPRPEVSKDPRTSWVHALDRIGDATQYLGGKWEQRKAMQGAEAQAQAAEQANRAGIAAQGRMYGMPGAPSGQPPAAPPQAAPAPQMPPGRPTLGMPAHGQPMPPMPGQQGAGMMPGQQPRSPMGMALARLQLDPSMNPNLPRYR